MVEKTVSTPKMKRVGLNGDSAVALAAKQCNVDFIAAYPITPQTIIVERLSDYVYDGELDAAFVPVESEHSALSACVGASLTGARVFTATASQGLALMYEILYIASSLRTPIVMALGNRAFSAPINIHASHDDAYAARDAGWIELFSENVQEAYDLTIQAFKIAEDEEVLLPAIVNLDGFVLTHSLEQLYIFDDEDVKKFLPPKYPIYKYNLDFEKPYTYGPLAFFDYYIELKRQQAEAMKNAYKVAKKVFKEFSEYSGREYKPIKTYGMEDAEVAVVSLGSTSGTVRYVAKKLREKGEKVGSISLTLYRPFPINEFLEAVKGVKILAVMDRSYSFGSPSAPLFSDISSTLINEKERPMLFNVIYGLGGRDFTACHAEEVFKRAKEYAEKGEVTEREVWVGVRE
ncbi:MAG: pyruvate ferredoxin oxidoreductase [Candidatus Asgardarchaeia archaeon]